MTPTDQPTTRGTETIAGAPLAERHKRILDFEREWGHRTSPKEEAVLEEFGLTAARYYQILNAVIDLPAAIVYDPMLVRRLQRVRDAKMSARTLRQPHHETTPPSHS